MLIRKLRNKLFSERHNGRVYGCGLIRDKKDSRDFVIGGSLFGYTPAHTVLALPIYDIKDQAYNTCTQEAATGVAEGNERVALSEEYLSSIAKKDGYIQQDGFSSLKQIATAVCNHGICEKALLNNNDHTMSYEKYISFPITDAMNTNAATHKQKSYANVIGRSARLKALDEGSRLFTGINWYSGFNMYNGFGAPWIIRKFLGNKVGGHALYILGYDLPRKVYIVQNSYGKGWGGYKDSSGTVHPGCFAIDMDFFDKNGYECYMFIDLNQNTEELIKAYEGKDVKGTDPTIYHITGGQKRAYPDKLTFYAFGGRYGDGKDTFVPIAQSLLNSVNEIAPMDVQESPHWNNLQLNWDFIKVLSEPSNIAAVQSILNSINGNMTITQKFPCLGSSVDPEKISLTIQGIASYIIPLVVWIATQKGFNLQAEDLASAVTTLTTIIATCITFVGIVRKIWVSRKK